MCNRIVPAKYWISDTILTSIFSWMAIYKRLCFPLFSQILSGQQTEKHGLYLWQRKTSWTRWLSSFSRSFFLPPYPTVPSLPLSLLLSLLPSFSISFLIFHFSLFSLSLIFSFSPLSLSVFLYPMFLPILFYQLLISLFLYLFSFLLIISISILLLRVLVSLLNIHIHTDWHYKIKWTSVRCTLTNRYSTPCGCISTFPVVAGMKIIGRNSICNFNLTHIL